MQYTYICVCVSLYIDDTSIYIYADCIKTVHNWNINWWHRPGKIHGQTLH